MVAIREFQFVVGPETSDLPTLGTPSADTDLLSLGYANSHYTQGKLSVADVTALKAITNSGSTARVNGDVVIVRSTDHLYRFDSASSATGDDDFVVTPTTGTGRWLRISINPRAATAQLNMQVKGDSGNAGKIELFESTSNGTSKVIAQAPASLSGDVRFQYPNSNGNADDVLKSDGSGNTFWGSGGFNATEPTLLENLGLECTVSGNALTVSVKQADGSSDATPSSLVKVAVRSATQTSGAYDVLAIDSALSVTVSSGSTLGHASAISEPIWVYLLNFSGTPELCISTRQFNDVGLISTTSEGGAGGADSRTVAYSASARTNVSFRAIGYLTSTQTTAGTWAAVPTLVAVGNVPTMAMGVIADRTSTSRAAGYIGEEKLERRVRSAGVAIGASATPQNVTASALSLEAGVWLISAAVGFDWSGTTSVTRIEAGVSLTSATLPVADRRLAFGDNENSIIIVQAASVPAGDMSAVIPAFVVRINATTSFYLVAQATYTVSGGALYGGMYAIRIA